ncbi:putative dehydrogenase [Aliiruegeria haliotis]|uniref:Putative dehydrogenase n=1 Tax=Aliiruegeria haliotis TaxID=1280846 RepID=A0A2T0RLP6_9RHOB|nr:Gfo/Idh/MocA family oxidoreductase [Aliiruegeria haliotis]PRY22116.1 putative dehydrogenase [Aliiruegeria haliotis]
MRVGVIGCGFFAGNHLRGWQEVEGARVTAICDSDPERLEAAVDIAGHDVQRFRDADDMLGSGLVDFVDIITPPHTHCALIRAAAAAGVPAIVQKPLSLDLKEAEEAVAMMEARGLPLMVHENFRFQAPMRRLLDVVRGGEIGRPTYARVAFRTAWDIYAGQPYLADLERFILFDVGVHVVDLIRSVLGDVVRVSCETDSIRPGITGEDSATLLLRHENGAIGVVECSYASPVPGDPFPQFHVTVEGTDGAVVLAPDLGVTIRKGAGEHREVIKPEVLPWMEPPWEVVQDSVIAIQRHWLDCLSARRETETSGRDNLQTLRVIEAAYRAAGSGRAERPVAAT